MFWFIAGISLLNIAVGYALSAWSEKLLKDYTVAPESSVVATLPRGAASSEVPAPFSAPLVAESSADDPSRTASVGPEDAALVAQDREQEGLPTEGPQNAAMFVEASVQVLRLEVGRYRQSLIDIDCDVRVCRETRDRELFEKCRQDLDRVNGDWLKRQAEAAEQLAECKGSLGELTEVGESLCQVLDEQRAEIESSGNDVKVLDFAANPADGCTRMSRALNRLIDMAHALRDRIQESITCIARQENRLDSLDRNLRNDALTDFHNRTGLEAVFHKWWREDPERQRQVSLGVVDIDRLGLVNEQYGALAGDRLIQGLAHLLSGVVLRNRGFQVAARVEGQRFVCFLGDTGPRNAVAALERFRQTVAAARFEFNDLEFDLAVSCAVTEVFAGDTTETIHRRIAEAVRGAKAAGRNCTVLDDGNGAKTVQAPRLEVKSRVVKITD